MACVERSRRDTRTALALCALPVVLLLGEQWRTTAQVDDAYITYRYAENWLAGHGLVFNPGERVEGFTSPLFTALVAAGIALGADAPAVGHLLGLLGAVGAMLATALLARALAPTQPPWLAGAAPLLLWLSPSFVRWTTSGMETSLFAAALTASLAASAAARTGWMTLALVVTTLARPEGALVAAVLYGAGLVSPAARRAHLRGMAVYAAGLLALAAARYAYYGSLLPNTFHAKVGGVPWQLGLHYLRSFLASGAAWLLPPAAVAAAALRSARPGAALVVVFAAYVVAIGGDLLGNSRFLVPLLPVLAALAAAGVGVAWSRTRAGGVAAAACLGAAGLWLGVGPTLPSDGTRRARVLEQARRVDRTFEAAARRRAALLRARGETDVRLAAGAIGALGYHTGLPVIDILGLTDAHIARAPLAEGSVRWPGHLRSDAAYVLAQAPDYLLIRKRDPDDVPLLQAVTDLWARPELARDYVWDEPMRGYRRLRPGKPAPPAPPR